MFNPFWPDVLSYHGYGRALGLNWVWALNLTAFHAIVSITIPILLVELLFPKQAALPWLGRKGRWGLGIALALTSALGLVVFGFVTFRHQGFSGPPLIPYLGTLALAIGLVALGLRVPRSTPKVETSSPRPLPRLWLLRVVGFGAMFLYFAAEPLLQFWAPFELAFVIFGVVLALLAWRIRLWSRRAGWGARQMLALASGVLGLFILVFAPVEEVAGSVNGKPTHGQSLVALGFLVLLIVLARRVTARAGGTEKGTIAMGR